MDTLLWAGAIFLGLMGIGAIGHFVSEHIEQIMDAGVRLWLLGYGLIVGAGGVALMYGAFQWGGFIGGAALLVGLTLVGGGGFMIKESIVPSPPGSPTY